MLSSLHISNLVLVPELLIDFRAGFNTVTGETGAGKSLILGALHLLAGGRASAAVIRKGAKSCEVSGTILLENSFPGVKKSIDDLLEEYGLPPCDEGQLLLRRTVTESGSRAFINGAAVTAAILKTFGDQLIDIHGPNDSHSLLQPSRQLQLLDLYGGCKSALQAVSDTWGRLAANRKELQSLKNATLAPEEVALLNHQLQEIDRAQLKADEEEQLIAQHRLAANSARLRELAAMLSQGLSQSDNSLVEALIPWIRYADELAELDSERGTTFQQRLNGVSEELADLASELADYGYSLDIDEEALQELEERIGLIQTLRRKYGPTLEDVIATGERLRQRLSKVGNRSAELERLQREEQQLRSELESQCAELRRLRQEAAAQLAPAIEEKLQNLGFLKALFRINLTAIAPGATGADAAEFYFAANPGEEIQPLRHAASSGEVARVMLAIKTVLSEVDDLPILVFDEIDANIGGRTATAVAAELRAVGRKHQVFSITHLPLIAAAGDQHYQVEKQVSEDRTTATMTLLEGDRRVAELVRMLGADANDAPAIAHAREMLENNSQ